MDIHPAPLIGTVKENLKNNIEDEGYKHKYGNRNYEELPKPAWIIVYFVENEPKDKSNKVRKNAGGEPDSEAHSFFAVRD